LNHAIELNDYRGSLEDPAIIGIDNPLGSHRASGIKQDSQFFDKIVKSRVQRLKKRVLLNREYNFLFFI
jgi:hypothetical protein